MTGNSGFFKNTKGEKCRDETSATSVPMKIFISQPMRGREHEDILKERMKMIKAAEGVFGNKCKIIENYIASNRKINPLSALGMSIVLMSEADAVIFAPGWKDASGCRIAQEICRQYGIKYIDYELWFCTPEQNDEQKDKLPKSVDVRMEEECSDAAEASISDIEPCNPAEDREICRSLDVEEMKARLELQLQTIHNKIIMAEDRDIEMLLAAQAEIVRQYDALTYGDEM